MTAPVVGVDRNVYVLMVTFRGVQFPLFAFPSEAEARAFQQSLVDRPLYAQGAGFSLEAVRDAEVHTVPFVAIRQEVDAALRLALNRRAIKIGGDV